jgi:plastocyanin
MIARRLTRLAVLLLAVGLVAGACSKSSNTSSSGGSTTPASSPSSSESEGGQITINGDNANDKGTKDVSGMDEASIEVDDFYFEPTIIKGTAGQQISLELENEGDALHNFTLSEQSIDQDIQPGSSETVSVTFPQSGQLEFFCKYHKGSGMVGALST